MRYLIHEIYLQQLHADAGFARNIGHLLIPVIVSFKIENHSIGSLIKLWVAISVTRLTYVDMPPACQSNSAGLKMCRWEITYLIIYMYCSEIWIIAFAKLEVLVHSLCRELHLPHINSRAMNNLRLFVWREEDEVIRTWNWICWSYARVKGNDMLLHLDYLLWDDKSSTKVGRWRLQPKSSLVSSVGNWSIFQFRLLVWGCDREMASRGG